MKRLYRSRENKIFAGIFGGLGDYFDVDPVLLRAICILILVFTGFVPGLIAYIFAALVIPKEPEPARRPPAGRTGQARKKK